jgi:hypothetical protein
MVKKLPVPMVHGDLLEVCENATRGGIVANGEEAGIPLDAECAELEGGCAIPTCLFDFNGDNVVNGLDVPPLVASFGLAEGTPGYQCIYDFNGDKVINGLDIPAFVAQFGLTCP